MKNFPPSNQDAAVSMAELDVRARVACKRLVQSEWELAQLLTTMHVRGQWRDLGCSSIVDYTDQRLGMPADHLFSLLRLFSDVAAFPHASEAWRTGAISRSKLREILRVMTSATEQQWLDFARRHTCRELERQVVLRPRAMKAKEQSPTAPTTTSSATTAAAPVASTSASVPPPAVTSIIAPSITGAAAQQSAKIEQPELLPADDSEDLKPSPDELPSPRLVRIELTFEPAQYAAVEAALDLLRASGAGRSREALFVEMAERVLANAEARTRRRHAIVVEKDAATGEVAYVTGRGYLPAKAGVHSSTADTKACDAQIGEANAKSPDESEGTNSDRPSRVAVATESIDVDRAMSASTEPAGTVSVGNDKPPAPASTTIRKRLPAAIKRLVFERAGYACQRCGRRQGLQIHHIDRVCRGGTDDPDRLELLCRVCHTSEHHDECEHDTTFILGRYCKGGLVNTPEPGG
jgi:hypothetical protein